MGRLANTSSSVGGCLPVGGVTGWSADLHCDVHPQSLKGEFPQPGQLLEQGGGGARFQLREQSVSPGGAGREGGGEADWVDRVPGPHSVALHRDREDAVGAALGYHCTNNVITNTWVAVKALICLFFTTPIEVGVTVTKSENR